MIDGNQPYHGDHFVMFIKKLKNKILKNWIIMKKILNYYVHLKLIGFSMSSVLELKERGGGK